MHADRPDPSRRTALALGGGAALTAALALGGGTAQASPRTGGGVARLRRLEREHGARLGVFARDMRTGRTVAHRAHERFPMASVFKTLAVAAVLRDHDRDGEFLARRVHYTAVYAGRSGHSPVTGLAANVSGGMTIAALCDAALRFSDNAAANLLLEELGGPTAITRFCRSLGDGVTRLDRWEPELNSAEPSRVTDTTTPHAIGLDHARLMLGDALAPHDRERLTGWMLRNTTSAERFRRGLPADWRLADKTGSARFGGAHDVGIAWRPDGTPVVLAVLTARPEEDAPSDNALVARTAAVLAQELA
ncbi:class A beta-lactamase [Streptomyces tanashiensis]|uniref:class A beta-lactamase n=1 Tax=Streptomyces tanashiensis TaxID=67367 RepID=UPI0036ED5D95